VLSALLCQISQRRGKCDGKLSINGQTVDIDVEPDTPLLWAIRGLFYGGCTMKDGRIEQTNFDNYNSMRIREMPKVETIVMPSGGFWGGVGEPTVTVAAPAVLNVYFAATGKRIRSVPLSKLDIAFA